MAISDMVKDFESGLHTVEVEHELDALCHRMVEFAQSIAPVFGDQPPKRDTPGIGEPEDYKNSIKMTPVGVGHRRVGSADPKSIWIELGSRHMPEYAVFAKTSAMFGGHGAPIVDEGVQEAQHKLREALESLEKVRAQRPHGSLSAGVQFAQDVAAAKRAVEQARLGRSAAFKAARGGGPRRRGRR